MRRIAFSRGPGPTGSVTAEIGQDRELGLIDFEAGLEPPLHMPRPGKRPQRKPKGEPRIDYAADPKKRVAKPEPCGRREDGRLEHDTEAARDDDGRAERGEEDRENVAAVPRHSLGSFGVHDSRFRGFEPNRRPS